MQNYEVVRELGRGAAGDVVLAKDKKTGELVAIKEIMTTIERPQITSETMKEVEVMKSLVHPNVVGYRASFKENGRLYIAMEYIDGGDLAKFIAERKKRLLSEEQVLKIFVQIVVGLKYIHDRKIVHRDLKPQNIFMTRVGVVKIGDFGVSRSIECSQDLCKTQIGTPYYLSPEIWNSEPYGIQTDIWSAGCILYELCSLRKPFVGQNINQLLIRVVQGKYEPLSNRYSTDLRNLVAQMLNQDPSKRPRAEDILVLPFITNSLCSMIKENEAKLKTVNIVTTELSKSKKRKKTAKRGKRPSKKKSEPELISVATELPLPDEELPKWAQKMLCTEDKGSPEDALSGTGTLTEDLSEDKEDFEPNEWEELCEATEALQESLPVSQRSERQPTDEEMTEEEARMEIDRLTTKLNAKLGESLFQLLCKNIETEELESSKELIDIMQSEDKESVDDARRLLALQKML